MVPDRPDEPYGVYTFEFDSDVRARDLPRLIAAEGLTGVGWKSEPDHDLASRIDQCAASCAAADTLLAGEKQPTPDQVICFLIDLSGSMASRLPTVVGELSALDAWLREHGVATAIYGFTTVGWKGGAVRKKWLAEGSPSYPGRLCALLHVVVGDPSSPPGEADWEALLRVELLHENVDGEALAWARSRLAEQSGSLKTLFVLSDGAPVDDATIYANGNGMLVRHLLAQIEDIEREGSIDLVGIGLEYRVTGFYRQAELVDGTGSVIDAVQPFIR